MKTKTIYLSILMLILGHMAGMAGDSQADEQTSQLVITVTGFENSDGVAKIAIVNSKENFDEKDPFKGINAPIIDNQVVQTVTLPYGEYALKIYHDENKNNALDKMMFGIPKEKYGFSNNARAAFGPPEFEAAAFKIDSAKTTMSIEVE